MYVLNTVIIHFGHFKLIILMGVGIRRCHLWMIFFLFTSQFLQNPCLPQDLAPRTLWSSVAVQFHLQQHHCFSNRGIYSMQPVWPASWWRSLLQFPLCHQFLVSPMRHCSYSQWNKSQAGDSHWVYRGNIVFHRWPGKTPEGEELLWWGTVESY